MQAGSLSATKFEETQRNHFKYLYFDAFIILQQNYLKVINMLERPRFIFEQQGEGQEEAMPQDHSLVRHVTSVQFDQKNEIDERGFLRKTKDGPGNSSSRRQQPYSKRINPEISLATHKSQSHIDDPSLKTRANQTLRYKQPESHMIVNETEKGNNPAKGSNQNNPNQYEDKIINHLQEAKGMKPNTFFREDNQSPIPPNDPRYTFAPPVYAPTEFDPYKYIGLGKKKSNNKSYNIILESDAKKKNKPIKTLANTTNESSFHNSSQVALNEAENKQVIAEPSAQIIQEQPVDLCRQYPSIGQTIPYSFYIQKIFGKNFLNPEYKIYSSDGDLIITGQKQSFHVNSHYNIFNGDPKNNKIIGKVLGNFGGTQFNIYDADPQELLATVCYVTEVACNAFRKLEIYVKSPESSQSFNDILTKGKNMKELYEAGMKDDIVKIITKQPTWREDLRVYVLNLKGKGKRSSAKNMVLMKENRDESSLLFCKHGDKKYYLEISRPFNLLITMGLLVSSFDFKLLCQ